MGSTDNSALMTLDIKRNRFRIHKSTLCKLGYPRYIQFLINPEEMFIAILGTDKPMAGGTSNKVNVILNKDYNNLLSKFNNQPLWCY